MRPLLLIALVTLAACGADGPPLPPGQSATTATPVLFGQLKVGVVGR